MFMFKPCAASTQTTQCPKFNTKFFFDRAVPHSADLPLSGHPEGALPVLGCCMMRLVMATPLQRERPPLLMVLHVKLSN